MIPVANKPVLQYVVESLVKNGIRDIVMVVGYKKERIMSYFEDGRAYDASIEYVTQEKQLGTGHALFAAKDSLGDEFVVLPGDNIVDSTAIGDLLNQKKGTSILITESSEPSKYGVVVLSEGWAKDIIEKPEERISNLISTGIYMLSSDVFGHLEGLMKDGKYNLTDAIRKLASIEDIFGIFTSGVWADAIYPWDLLNLNNTVLGNVSGKTSGTIEKNVVVKGNVSIGENTIIRSGSYIVGPVIIGKGCDIGPNVCIYPSTSIGDNVSADAFGIIEHSILMDDVNLGPNSYVSNSVLGRGVRTSSNLNVNVGEAIVNIENEVHKVQKIGTLIGEDSHLEGSVITDPGTIVGARSRISALKLIKGNIPDESIVM
jgi:glucose-1-phosphate thymidylyltransferase